MTKLSEYLSTEQAAIQLGCTLRLVQYRCKQRRFGQLINGGYLIDPAELADFIRVAGPAKGGGWYDMTKWDRSKEIRKWRRKREQTNSDS